MKKGKWDKGFDLHEAMLESAGPDRREEFERLNEYDSPLGWVDEPEDTPRRQFRSLEAQLERELLDRLEIGELIAFGYDSRSSADAQPSVIAPHRWRVLTPNFRNSSAEGFGLLLAGIRVFSSRAELSSNLHQVDPFHTGMPGRITAKHKIVAEFERRARSGKALRSLRAEARALSDWLLTAHPDAPPTTSRTIENQVREAHRKHFGSKTTK